MVRKAESALAVLATIAVLTGCGPDGPPVRVGPPVGKQSAEEIAKMRAVKAQDGKVTSDQMNAMFLRLGGKAGGQEKSPLESRPPAAEKSPK